MACHGDILLSWFLDPDTEEHELALFFKDVALYKGKKGGAAGGNRRRGVPNLGRTLFACSLQGTPLQEASTFGNDALRQLHRQAPWRKFYTNYVCRLACLCQALSTSYTTRGRDTELLQLARDYTAGCRDVFGIEFTYLKTIYHRLAHLTVQPKSKKDPGCP